MLLAIQLAKSAAFLAIGLVVGHALHASFGFAALGLFLSLASDRD